jgi:hypothetical protein
MNILLPTKEGITERCSLVVKVKSKGILVTDREGA